MFEKINVNKVRKSLLIMVVDYVQYGPVTPDNLALGTFKSSVNNQLNNLRIQQKPK